MTTTTRYRDGSVTVTLDGGLRDFVRQAVEASLKIPLQVMEAEAQQVADAAAARWYTEVTRRTGKSGDIQVVTTVTTEEVRVSIGSTDDRRSKGAKVAAWFVRAPGPLSQVERKATREEYAAARAAGKKHWDAYWVREDNPRASDGHFLLQTLVRKPGMALSKALAQRLAERLAVAMAEGAR